jgi:RNA polymerase sigma-70 factor (ECF subfamily)
MKLLNNLDAYSEQQNFMAWAKRIMVNTCIDIFRKNSKHVEREYPFDPADYYYKNASVDWNLAEMNMRTEDLLAMVQSLPEKSKQVFNLYVFEDFKHHQIADLLDMSEGTSKWHLSKARKLLQQKILLLMDQENAKINVS